MAKAKALTETEPIPPAFISLGESILPTHGILAVDKIDDKRVFGRSEYLLQITYAPYAEVSDWIVSYDTQLTRDAYFLALVSLLVNRASV